MKRCTRCRREQPPHAFHADRKRPDGRYPYCKECVKEYRKANPQRHDPQRKRSEHLRRRYGITREQYEQMLSDQNGRCAICEEPMQQVCVDHDHTSGVVRGLLCHDCNLMLGRGKDQTRILRRGADYLERHTQHGT